MDADVSSECRGTMFTSGAFAPPGHVALVVEVAEEHDEADAVGEDDGVHGVGKVTLGEEVITSVCGEKNKLQLGNKQEVQILTTHTLSQH